MKKTLLFCSTVFLSFSLQAQEYQFTPIKTIDALPVISQDKTGTCWSYSTISFIEAEILRTTGKKIDLSEMYNVRHTFFDKTENFIFRRGKAQLDQGGLAHDVINSISKHGIVPIQEYSGLTTADEKHNHSELTEVLKRIASAYSENPGKKLSPHWRQTINSVLDIYLGKVPQEFLYEGKKYTPLTFLSYAKINPESYLSLTSFINQPYYQPFILNIPDNYSNGSFYNIPLDELIETIDHALENGFSIALDCDVSEPTFSGKHGIAVIPANETDNKAILTEIKPEKEITAAYRQQEYENFNTQDDHLMHIVGKVKDQNNTVYYKVKNSWGSENLGNEGYIYMSVPYLKLKTISIMLHEDGIPKKTIKKLK